MRLHGRQAGPQASPGKASTKEGALGVELAEVCMDMMARYTYSNLSTLPTRYDTENLYNVVTRQEKRLTIQSILKVAIEGGSQGSKGVKREREMKGVRSEKRN